jgi:hypothetical protein
MNPRLAIKSPTTTQPAQPGRALTIADINQESSRALALAWAARLAAEAGDHEKAALLRAEHDAIYEELYKCLPKE